LWTGGAAAINYAVRHPDRVTHLVLYGCAVRGRLARDPNPEQVEEAEAQLKLIELGWGNENAAFRQLHTSQLMPDATADQARAFNELMRRTATPTNAAKLLRAHWFEVDNRPLCPEVQCPTLVLHAREDARVPFEEGRSLAALIPGARLVALESRNHILVEGEPAWQQLVAELDGFLPTAPGESSALSDDLTPREQQVLELIARGLDNRAIGTQLGISERTVRNFASSIFSKLGVSSRAQAIVQAREAGFGSSRSD
jgi:ATP/maltotriose-dependent transcriptional regulator MalT